MYYYQECSQNVAVYPDINDIIEQQERSRCKRTRKKTPEMDKQNIKIRLVLGHFVSNAELDYLYRHSTLYEIAELDKLFQGRVTAAHYEATNSCGLSHGYSEGYVSEVMEVNGRKEIIMVPSATPDIDIEKNSSLVTHTVLDVLENNLHEDFDKALRWIINNYPQDAIRALGLDYAIDVKYVKYISKRVESSWDQRWDDFKADVVLLAVIDVTMPVTVKSGATQTIEQRIIRKQIEYRFRYTFDLIGKTGRRTCTGPMGAPSSFYPPDNITKQKEWATDASFRMNYKTYDDFVRMAEKILTALYPEALDRPVEIDGDLLVERLSDYLKGTSKNPLKHVLIS